MLKLFAKISRCRLFGRDESRHIDSSLNSIRGLGIDYKSYGNKQF